METFTSFEASGLPLKEVGGILADYLTLNRTRMFRRVLILRCGPLAIAAFIAGSVIDGLSAWARWVPVGLFAGVPTCVWIAEFVLEYRLSARLNRARLRKS